MTASLASLGWIWLVAAAATAPIALALVLWSVCRPARTARAEHARGVAALAACVVIVTLVPVAIGHYDRVQPLSFNSTSAAQGKTVPPHPIATVVGREAAPLDVEFVASGVGLVWLAVATWMAIHLVGGWWRVRTLVARSVDPASRLVEAARRLASEMNMPMDVGIRHSDDVDTPVVAGIRPVILLPRSLDAASPGEITSLLAHELAHVLRCDYAANLLQSAIDVLLGVLPGARWISAKVRETREYACDELAVRVAADRRAYVQALASLAAGSQRQLYAAPGVAGPPLERRVDRLLNGTRAPRRRVASILLAAAGAALATHATVQALEMAASRQASATTSSGAGVSMFWAYEQPRAGIVVPLVTSSSSFACDRAEIRNDTNVTVTGVAFAGAMTAPSRRGVTVVTGELIRLRLAPGAKATVNVHLIPQSDLVASLHGTTRAHFEVGCGLARVTYANGFDWESPPNPAALTAGAALGLIPAEIPRALLAPDRPGSRDHQCTDDRGHTYTLGAIVPIRNEPGNFGRCVEQTGADGMRELRWVEFPVAGVSK